MCTKGGMKRYRIDITLPKCTIGRLDWLVRRNKPTNRSWLLETIINQEVSRKKEMIARLRNKTKQNQKKEE